MISASPYRLLTSVRMLAGERLPAATSAAGQDPNRR
jgi:hypothetical protein